MEKRKYPTFKIGGYTCKIAGVGVDTEQPNPLKDPEVRLNIWMEFEPNVGSIIATYISLPVKDYTAGSLFQAINMETRLTIQRLLKDQKEREKVSAAAEDKRKKMNNYASRMADLLDVK